jgi:serine/threonine-protein kinase RsbT
MVEAAEKRVPVKDEYDIVMARSAGKNVAKELGFGIVDQTRIATAISELARNIIVHAVEGMVEIRHINRDDGVSGMEVVAIDTGPGIPDIEQAMKDGFTTGHGLGVGLGGTSRLVDDFEIESRAGKGTRVLLRKWL